MSGDQLNLLGKFRLMAKNLMGPTYLSQTPDNIWFGAKVCLKAPYVQGVLGEPEVKGVLVSTYISEISIDYHQDFFDGINCGAIHEQPVQRNTFVITPAEYFTKDGDFLVYNQDFSLVLDCTANTKKPLYLRFDPEPLPGQNTHSPLYLSKTPTTNTRFKVLPVQDMTRTRFEKEYTPVHVNEDVVIVHSKSNQNLCVGNEWQMGFITARRSLTVKTKLDVHKMETAENIWHIHSAPPEIPQ